MGYAALTGITLVALVAIVLMAQAMRWRERGWERKEHAWEKERRDLVNRVMYLADRPWTPPPYEDAESGDQPEREFIYAEQAVLD